MKLNGLTLMIIGVLFMVLEGYLFVNHFNMVDTTLGVVIAIAIPSLGALYIMYGAQKYMRGE